MIGRERRGSGRRTAWREENIEALPKECLAVFSCMAPALMSPKNSVMTHEEDYSFFLGASHAFVPIHQDTDEFK